MSSDKCQHCGADTFTGVMFWCGTKIGLDSGKVYQSDLCKERAARQKAEAEAAELRKTLEMVEHEVALVYDHVTGGLFSKCNTEAKHVIAAADQICANETEEANRRGRMGWDEMAKLSKKLQKAEAERDEAKQSLKSISTYIESLQIQLKYKDKAFTDALRELQQWREIAGALAAALGETHKADAIPGADEALARFKQAEKGGAS